MQLVELSKRALTVIREKQFEELSTRILMKSCGFFATAEEAQKVLDHLEILGYISIKDAEERHRRGRPASPLYLVNPLFLAK